MSNVSFFELIILFVIGLIVLGPERLPRVANQLGTWLGQARRMTRVMKRQLEEELRLEEDNRIKPAGSVHKPAWVTPANETDDGYSPAHGPAHPGTGAGRDEGSAATAEDEADRQNLEEDLASAVPEQERKEKVS